MDAATPPTADPTDYLTVPQVAFALRLSQETVWRMARSGTLRSFRVGNGRGQVRILCDDFHAYLTANRLPAGLAAVAASAPPSSRERAP
ncbi:helix-turn-helix domain-containing protein [Kitasatospora sp. NRRL B-11411]|uniref:helix-turn-helix domain-containing protein n=1 Tax=Kitasatospora sp. NRRL B-11411 TaxID=1463822 RepID=UPI0004C2FBA5|nr:helix-turn-helix domain-containing protein [Kitasatospora sp. NRRL B-11411]